ncbi:hypothetical protein ABIA31_002876 [Catenulispora sp. MAP5-51]
MNSATTPPEEPPSGPSIEGGCDVLQLCEIWLALDFPNHQPEPADQPTPAPPAPEEAS